jgi:hypothetical protein
MPALDAGIFFFQPAKKMTGSSPVMMKILGSGNYPFNAFIDEGT